MTLPFGGDSSFYLDLYNRYRKDRHSVPSDWAVYFDAEDPAALPAAPMPTGNLAAQVMDVYRRFGHLEAQLDPLQPNEVRAPALERVRSALASDGDAAGDVTIAGEQKTLTGREAADIAASVYGGSLGLDVEHLRDEEERDWWYAAVEAAFSAAAEPALVADTLESIVLADEFETFMRTKYPTKKRFGCEGAESSIVFMREIFRKAPAAGVGTAVIGGMHRGRLATLATALGKSPSTMIAEIMGRDLSGGTLKTGDVPYHLGYAGDVSLGEGTLKVMLMPHPSHLLVVAPVTLGLARAVRDGAAADDGGTLCLLMHTDAAISGQGLAAELMQIGGLGGYSPGGAIHLVVNNQIGFTTLPSEGRSAHYCTDIGKSVGAPILHVNGDDPVAVAQAGRLALAWNRAYGKDVLIDLVCYRRYGHNELDEPRFTQPEIWGKVDQRANIRKMFSDTVAAGDPGALTAADAAGQAFKETLQAGFENAATVKPNEELLQSGAWENVPYGDEAAILTPVETGIEVGELRDVGLKSSAIPDAVDAHPKVRQFYAARAETIQSGSGLNFATAEALAFASLLAEGKKVRMSGQDTVRGTFTQRHLRVHEAGTGQVFEPLMNVADDADACTIINSPLTEYAVLSFEYGHSLYNPDHLTIWEAQFGDFLNGAQIVVDQYIVSAESKWGVKSGLVVMLPHGLEGQGPDHSSARIERIALLCADANIILAQPSTPANLFHLLRRQIKAPWRKPLFLISPKSLLRNKAAVSDLKDMAAGTHFEEVIVSPCDGPAQVQRIVLCAGKVFYELEQARAKSDAPEAVWPVRIEQFYPFPADRLKQALAPFAGAECVWLQDEPENQGAWPMLREEFRKHGIEMSPEMPIVSRPALPVAAGGSVERHEREQQALIESVLALRSGKAGRSFGRNSGKNIPKADTKKRTNA